MPFILMLICFSTLNAEISVSDPAFKFNSLYDYLILVPNDSGIKLEANRLAEIKWEKGLKTTIVNLDSISNNGHGFDLPNKIRNFFKTAYYDWGITWVLIMGDYNHIPARKIGYDTVNTDLYYSCLESEWTMDTDSLYGNVPTYPSYQMECQTDSLGFVTCEKLRLTNLFDDVLPDIYVGRLPVGNQQEAKIMVDKIILYGNTPQNSAFTTSMLLLGEIYDYRSYSDKDAIPVAISTNYWHYKIKGTYQAKNSKFNNFNFTEIYEDSIAPDGRIIGDTIFRGTDVYKKELSKGYNLVYYLGHGCPLSWQTCSFREPRGDLFLSDVDELASPTFMNIITLSCQTMGFKNDSCIAKHFLTNPNGGAVSYVGSTTALLAINPFPYYLSTNLAIKEVNRIGQAFSLAQIGVYKTCNTAYASSAYQFWGDPELEIWTKNITDADTFEINESRIGSDRCQISVLPQLDSVLICMYKKDEIFKRGYTHNGSIVFDGISFDLLQVTITATKHDYLPSRKILDLYDIGIEEKLDAHFPDMAVNISPNPFCEIANISCFLKLNQVGHIDILDIAGKKLFSQEITCSGVYKWNAHYMPSGLYFLKAVIGEKQYSRKLLLMR